MRIGCMDGDIRTVRADMAAAFLFEGEKRSSGALALLDAAVGGAVSAAVAAGDFTGKAGETFFLRPRGISSPRLLVVGLGKRDKFVPDAARQAMLPVVRTARKLKLSAVASFVPGAGEGGVSPATAARFAALGAALSSFEFDRYKSEKEHRVARLLFAFPPGRPFSGVRAAVWSSVPASLPKRWIKGVLWCSAVLCRI